MQVYHACMIGPRLLGASTILAFAFFAVGCGGNGSHNASIDAATATDSSSGDAALPDGTAIRPDATATPPDATPDAEVPLVCNAPKTKCGGDCADLQTSALHCGTCETS